MGTGISASLSRHRCRMPPPTLLSLGAIRHRHPRRQKPPATNMVRGGKCQQPVSSMNRVSLPAEINATPPSYEMAIEITSSSAPATPQPQLDDSMTISEPVDRLSKRKSAGSRDSKASSQTRGSIHSIEPIKEARRSGSVESPDSSLQSPQTPQSDLAIPDTKLHISFSDDENTENSEDSGVPRPPRALESMTFDEIEGM